MTDFTIPTHIFRGTGLSVLEAIVVYFREEHRLRYSQIAILLDRDERNIWTIYHRAKEKRDEKT